MGLGFILLLVRVHFCASQCANVCFSWFAPKKTPSQYQRNSTFFWLAIFANLLRLCLFSCFRRCSNRSKAVRGHALKGVCEIQAAAHAINLANQMGIYALTIFTASQFLVNAINAGWMLQWKQDSWQHNGRLVINHLDFKRLDAVLLKNAHMNIRFVHIPNNCGDPHIMAADQLAHEGAQKYQRIHSSTHY